MHQQSMMVGDMIPVHSEIPVHTEEMNNVGYDNSNSYTYDDLFPALPHAPQPSVQRNIQVNNKLRVGSSLHTQVSILIKNINISLITHNYITNTDKNLLCSHIIL